MLVQSNLGSMIAKLTELHAQFHKWEDTEKRGASRCTPGDDAMLSLHHRRAMFYCIGKMTLYTLIGFLRTQSKLADLPLTYEQEVPRIDTKVEHRPPIKLKG